MKTLGVIPSRYGSTRFPGKPLANILGKSMIQRVYEQCVKTTKLNDIIIATDDHRIYQHVLSFGGKVMMTSKKHKTGTERCNEISQNLNADVDVIINIQWDEPFINPLQIDELVSLFENSKVEIGTLAKKIYGKQLLKDKNTPKAIFDEKGNALNFCREISTVSNKKTYYKHIGIYAYKKHILEKICKLPETKNEKREQLEQLRWLDNKHNIKVKITEFETLSVDTPEDIKKIIAKHR